MNVDVHIYDTLNIKSYYTYTGYAKKMYTHFNEGKLYVV